MAGPGSGRDPRHHRASGVSAGADLVREVGSGSLAPGGRRRRSPRPGVTLFVVAFFASPLILIWWAGGHVSLKITGWPRWRLFAASLAGEVFIVWIRGGPVPALATHFSGLLRLAEQFGAPVVYLPAQGSFLIPQIALSVPVGLLAASLTRRTDLAVPTRPSRPGPSAVSGTGGRPAAWSSVFVPQRRTARRTTPWGCRSAAT